MSRYRGPSEAQANAEALARRGAPYTEASQASFGIQWDVHKREPDNLRDAVRAVRRAYADEVPDKLHEHAIGDDGTPRMTAKAEGYIFGHQEADDAARDPESGQRDLVGWYFSPFRANLATMERGTETQRLYAKIVSAVTIGGQDAKVAALAAGVGPECIAKGVALMALRAFLRSMTDMRVHAPMVEVA